MEKDDGEVVRRIYDVSAISPFSIKPKKSKKELLDDSFRMRERNAISVDLHNAQKEE